MKITTLRDIKYEGDVITVHRINNAVTIINERGLVLGLSLQSTKELYNLLGRLVADESKE